jgi:hypothetical protein
MMGSSGGWSSPRRDEAAAAQDSSLMGVLRWLGWDERQMGMQEGSCAADLTWRERAEKELAMQWCGLPFKPVEKEMGRGRGSRWARPRGGWRMRERRGALVWRSATRGGRQRASAIGRGRHHCHVNRGGRWAWATRVKGRGQLTRGTGARWGTRCQRRGAGRAGERGQAAMGHRQAGPSGIVPGGAVQTGFERNSKFKCFKQISNFFKLWSIRKVLFLAQKNWNKI